MTPDSLLPTLAFILVSICCPILAQCPRPAEMGDAINGCVRSQILLKNKSAFIGIDMERLRVMCSEFYTTIRCLSELAASCPEQRARFIEIRINSQQDFPHKELMHQLCSTQDLYEKYSLHFFCISGHKKKLHQCFRTFEKSIEPFVNSHDMTAQVCRPVDSLMSCMDSVMSSSSCSGEATNLLRTLVGPLMPHGVDVATCPAITGDYSKVQTKSPEKTSPEHYKVLYDNNSASVPAHFPWMSFVLITSFTHFVARG